MHPFTLAIDDADTPWGGCTTHALFLTLQDLDGIVELTDYPLLVRLDPAVPRKTRGNAALVLRGYSSLPVERLAELVWDRLDSYAAGRRPPGKGPGLAVVPTNRPWRNPTLRSLYVMGLRDYIPLTVAFRAARVSGVLAAGGSGVVGAVASLASLAPWDPYSFELIAYRDGGERCLNGDPLVESAISAECWGNYDLAKGPIASPAGPDPVLAGFRGSSLDCLQAYRGTLCSSPSGWVIFRSNQHTGVHVGFHMEARPYRSVRLLARVDSPPRIVPGGHVLLEVSGGPTVAFYRETGRLAWAARMLAPGDLVIVEGSLIPRQGSLTLAAEALTIVRAGQEYELVAPRCPRCGSRMKSMGRGKGYRCPKCGYRDPKASPIRVWVQRRIIGGRLTSPPRSARHLTLFHEARPRRSWSGLPKPLPPRCFYSPGTRLPPIVEGEC